MRYNPFNPQSPARPEFFVGRFNELQIFKTYLFQTINGSPMSMAIVGNRDIGKTSILTKFHEISKLEKSLVIRISNIEGQAESLVELADFILTNLKLEYIASRDKFSDKIKTFFKSLNVEISLGELGIEISYKDQKEAVVGLMRRKLENFWKHIKDDYSSIVILIDEAESIERIDGALMFLREVFQHLSQDSIKYMIVLCGKLNFPESMSEAFSPLNRFFPTTRLIYFNENETREFLKKSLSVVNCDIEDTAADVIHERSEGHPYIVVSMAFNIFNRLEENKNIITKELVETSMNLCKSRLEQDYFLSLYHPLTPKAKEILLKLSTKLHSTTFTFSQAVEILKMEKYYVSPYIQEMYRKGCINKLDRGKYEVFHKLFLEFLKIKKNNII